MVWESPHSAACGKQPFEVRRDSGLGFRFGPYFVEPVIAGLRADGTPYVASSDLIGAK